MAILHLGALPFGLPRLEKVAEKVTEGAMWGAKSNLYRLYKVMKATYI